MRSPATLLFPLGLLLVTGACVSQSARSARVNHPRAEGNLFSPLDLPAPTATRSGSGAPGHAYWQQQVDYVIEASLDPDGPTVTGVAQVTYTNDSPDELRYLWLHLEQNAYREDSIRAGIRGAETTGGYTLRHLRAGGTELPHAVYGTLARVELPEPLAPRGGQFQFEIAWEFDIARNAFRHGLDPAEDGPVFELAQWFPCVAVYDDVHGWNALPYIGGGEFYTNFGRYDVRLTVPRDHLCVATGVLQNPGEVYTAEQQERLAEARQSAETVLIRSAEEVGQPGSRPAGEGPLTWHFVAEDVRTFAWASSRAFILDAAALGDTLIQSAYPKEALPLWADSTQMLLRAIRGYNERLYPYPYPVATNVSGRAGGMEYPMIIFCRGRRSEASLYGVTTHEIGHNWFPMMVNSDERRHAWMDEGFNTFINHYSRPDWFEDGENTRRVDPARFAATMRAEDLLPIVTAPDYLPRRLVGQLQYTKTAVGLKLLREEILGPERFDYAFREYVRRWAFKSPRPADFFRTIEDAAGAELAWFWRGWFYETAWLDQAVADVGQPDGEEPGGVTVDNLGELVMPLDWRVTYADGSTESGRVPPQAWADTNRITVELSGTGRISAVVLDPREVFPDVDRRNNRWPRQRPRAAAPAQSNS